MVLGREGIRLAGISRDSMVLSYLLEPNWGKHGLEKLALHYLRETKTPSEELAGRGKNELGMGQAARAARAARKRPPAPPRAGPSPPPPPAGSPTSFPTSWACRQPAGPRSPRAI